jgi:monooxygenase
MDASGYQIATPVVPEDAHAWEKVPLVDLKSGYVLRSIGLLPKQGPAAPWRLHQNYPKDVRLMRRGALEDDGIRFTRATSDREGSSSAAGDPSVA